MVSSPIHHCLNLLHLMFEIESMHNFWMLKRAKSVSESIEVICVKLKLCSLSSQVLSEDTGWLCVPVWTLLKYLENQRHCVAFGHVAPEEAVNGEWNKADFCSSYNFSSSLSTTMKVTVPALQVTVCFTLSLCCRGLNYYHCGNNTIQLCYSQSCAVYSAIDGDLFLLK